MGENRIEPARLDSIHSIELSILSVPLATAVSDAKVLTGRQRPMSEISVLVAEIRSSDGLHGLGFSYSTRAGGPAQYAHAKEIAGELIGEDPNQIDKLFEKLVWAGAAAGRGGLAMQAIAALDIALYDMKAKRSGMPLATLLGAYRESVRVYNTSGGYLSATTGEVLENIERSIEGGLGGIKIKVGHPDFKIDLERVQAVLERTYGRVPLMVDANQQWDRTSALRHGRVLDQFGLTWIEEPIDAHDFAGLARLVAVLDTPIASGEMLTSVAEVSTLVERRAADIVQADAPRLGGVSQYLRATALAEHAGLAIAPHFVMELHIHLAATHARESWVEHFEWLTPLFHERLEVRNGRMHVPSRPGLGLSLSDEARNWVRERVIIAG
ncbi:MAG: mdlA [Microbacterium sp.]|jgi:L-alanine-DL-glutamate epimerase-like enolase superfamily enzyme|nr:mdlA [Microbacterium sp.]